MSRLPSDAEMQPYFAGEKLYGDDFRGEELERWFRDESEGYAHLVGEEAQAPAVYPYHGINVEHGFRHLPPGRFQHVLGFGSAHGLEVLPIAERVDRLTIVDASGSFAKTTLPVPHVERVTAGRDGTLPFDAGAFDLVLCLDVLHHIANVTDVLRELARVTAPGGHLLLREPTFSMGDWRQRRKGLTARERGIPLPLLERAVRDAGFAVERETRCMFPITGRIPWSILGPPYNSKVALGLDAVFCRLFAFNERYHATSKLQKLRPTEAFFVLRKP